MENQQKHWEEFCQHLLDHLATQQFIKPNELPGIDLYMDQVTTFMDEHLETTKRFESDKLLTKTMINNYTKSGLLPSPVKKKYTKDHMYLLTFIYYLKTLLSIEDIRNLLQPMTENFYGKENDVRFQQIYEEIFRVCSGTSQDTHKDVMKKFEESCSAFDDVGTEEQKEFLKMFSFVSMLSYDVYLKKQMIVSVIDEFVKNVPTDDANQKEDKK